MSASAVDRLRAGESAAFDEVYRVFRPRLFGFLLRLTGQPPVAEDLVAETFLRLARHAPALRPDTRLGAWLYTVARNLALSWRRWQILDVARSALGFAPSAPALPDAALAGEQVFIQVEAAIMTLPPALREVVLLVCVEGMEPAMAAEILGIRPDALRQRLSRGRLALAEKLGVQDEG